MRRWRRAHSPGFTLVELMVVVVIVGVLATLGLIILGQHQKHARTYETLAMVQSIRMAQERWRAENLVYLDVSTTWFPNGSPGDRRVSFLQSAADSPDGENWIYLNPTSNPLVYGRYRTNAGMTNNPMTWPLAQPVPGFGGWPSPPPDVWYTIQAIADTDGDGRLSFYVASSLNGEVYRRNEAE